MSIPDKHLKDIQKYDSSVDMKLADALYKRLAGSLARADARTVAFSDNRELGRIRNGYIKKTLEIEDRTKADKALEAVADKMKKDRNRSRLTVYYLLAQELRRANRVK